MIDSSGSEKYWVEVPKLSQKQSLLSLRKILNALRPGWSNHNSLFCLLRHITHTLGEVDYSWHVDCKSLVKATLHCTRQRTIYKGWERDMIYRYSMQGICSILILTCKKPYIIHHPSTWCHAKNLLRLEIRRGPTPINPSLEQTFYWEVVVPIFKNFAIMIGSFSGLWCESCL